MIIVIANQKGGAGKSTIALLLANYLTMIRNHNNVTVLDMDYQQSLSSHAEKARILENEPLYEVVASELSLFPTLKGLIERQSGQLVLIDLPGKMDDDGLVPIFRAADVILTPFAYDEFSVDSTVLFALVVRKIKPESRLVFIPNRIRGTVRYDTRAEVEKTLSGFGEVTAPLGERVEFQRTTTVHLPLSVTPLILAVFDPIYERYLKGGTP
jgi:chromosome partitioning protein